MYKRSSLLPGLELVGGVVFEAIKNKNQKSNSKLSIQRFLSSPIR